MRVFSTLFLIFYSLAINAQQIPRLEVQESGQEGSFRGLSVLSDSVAWVSGTGGSFLRTLNGGKTWETGQVEGADSLDFRSIHAFSAIEALLVSAGQPARIYRTENGGKSWQMVYKDTTGKAFFDAVAFWDKDKGLVMSDPVEGVFLLLSTADGGRSWKKVEEDNIPPAAAGEAGFAASGTGLVVLQPELALFGTGGPVVRVFRSTDGGKSWQASTTPMVAETASTGIYSMAMKDSLRGIALGGDYTRPNSKTNHLLLTNDGGKSWQKLDHSGLGGYRSGAAYVPGTANIYLAVGTNGIDISFNGGRNWQPLSATGMHAIRFAPSGKTGWASGANGQIIELLFQ
jgi:photosystem II stability/assembly factor-like uncharacterized protein